MTLKEKFENVEIMFESQIGILKYDELSETSNNCVQIADEHAIDFAKWNSYKYKYLENKGWFATTYQLEMDIFITSKQLLEIYKKEKGL